MIQFNCPNCQSEYKVDNSLAGGTATCNWCGKPIVVPQPHAPGTVTDDERDLRLQDPPIERPDPRQGFAPTGPADYYAGRAAGNWIWFILIIIVLNVILIPLTGWAIIPR